MQAFQSPTDLTDVGLRAKISALGENKPGVHLEIRIDPSDLLLREQGGKYSGAVYCLISDRSASAPLGEPAVLDLKPELTAEQYKMVTKEGLPFAQDHPTSDAVRQVRVILLDQNTNAVGFSDLSDKVKIRSGSLFSHGRIQPKFTVVPKYLPG